MCHRVTVVSCVTLSILGRSVSEVLDRRMPHRDNTDNITWHASTRRTHRRGAHTRSPHTHACLEDGVAGGDLRRRGRGPIDRQRCHHDTVPTILETQTHRRRRIVTHALVRLRGGRRALVVDGVHVRAQGSRRRRRRRRRLGSLGVRLSADTWVR